MQCRSGLGQSLVSVHEIFKYDYPYVYDMGNCNYQAVDELYIRLRMMKRYPAYFIEGSSDKINYQNRDNLERIQNYLLNGYKIGQIPGWSKKNNICKEWWIFRGWSVEQAKEKISEVQKGFSKLYVEDRKVHPEKYASNYSILQAQFWQERYGMGEEEARETAQKIQRYITSQQAYINKYGEEEGKLRYEQLREKQKENWKLCMEGIKRKGEESRLRRALEKEKAQKKREKERERNKEKTRIKNEKKKEREKLKRIKDKELEKQRQQEKEQKRKEREQKKLEKEKNKRRVGRPKKKGRKVNYNRRNYLRRKARMKLLQKQEKEKSE